MGKIETATQWMIDLAMMIHTVMTRHIDGDQIMTAPQQLFLHGSMPVSL